MNGTFRRAFTLIELLVVIAIIAILAAILFPVFAQAKQAAKKTQSLSNAKNQITGLIMYAGDTDDVLPQSESGCEDDGSDTQIQWYATVYPYIKNGDTSTNSHGTQVAYGNNGIFKDPSSPAGKQGQQYGLNRDIFPSNYCPALYNNGIITPGTSATAIDAPADKLAVAIKNVNGAAWSYPYFDAYEWMWTARFKKDASGNVIQDGSEIMSGLAPRDWGYVMNKDCSSPNSFEECGAGLSFRYNGQSIGAYIDGHAAAIAKGRLQWFKNVAFNNGYGYWTASWYPY